MSHTQVNKATTSRPTFWYPPITSRFNRRGGGGGGVKKMAGILVASLVVDVSDAGPVTKRHVTELPGRSPRLDKCDFYQYRFLVH